MPYTGSTITLSERGAQEVQLLQDGLSYHAVVAITGTRVGTLKERNRLAYHVDIYEAFRSKVDREGIPSRLGVGDDFGHYFAGFFDGEGCIVLWHRRRGDRAKSYPEFRLGLQIVLRQDDAQVLEYIRDNLGGILHLQPARENSPTKASAKWVLENIKELAEVIVPMFDKYPLRSKKRREYEIWRPLVVDRYVATLGGETTRGGTVSERFEGAFIGAMQTVQRLRKWPDSA